MSANTGKIQVSTRFKKGCSGNPKGRPAGAKNRLTQLAQQLLEKDAQSICRALVDKAKKGDVQAIKLVLDIAAASCKMQMMELADELIAHLTSDPNAEITIRVEIQAVFPDGVDDSVKRTVSENAQHLKLTLCEWEE